MGKAYLWAHHPTARWGNAERLPWWWSIVYGRLIVGVLIVAAFAPTVSGKGLLAAYDLVGTDPANDAVQPIVTGVNYPACGTGLSCGKYDILEVEMANDGDLLQVKLNTLASYRGTTSVLYVVHFVVGETKYMTCWNMQSAGQTTSSNDVAENTVGCSRFVGITQVGPATRAAGVEQGTDANGKIFVRWEVPKTAIADATALSGIVAEVWARSASTCCPGSTTQSQYTWNRADRAPDAGEWAYSLGPAAPDFELAFSIEPKNATAAPGETVNVTLGPVLSGNGSVPFNWSIEGLPEGWTALFDPESGNLSSGENATHTVAITPGSSSAQGVHNLTIVLASDNDLNATGNLTITVTPAPAPTPTSTSRSASPTATTGATATKNEVEGDGIPGAGLPVAAAAVAALALLLRRRRML